MTRPGNLREEMPTVAAFIDDLRAAFGAAEINAAIRAGIDGQPTFWARENGQEVGTRNSERGLTLDQIHVGPYSFESKSHGRR